MESAEGTEEMSKHWFEAVLDLFFPPRCGACGAPGAWLCPACLAKVEWLQPPLCPHCGESLQGGLCPRRHRHLEALDGLRSAAWHTGPLRPAIHRLKYGGQRVLAQPLAAIMVQVWRRAPLPADVLVPVPLHGERERRRGYNQSVLLARELGCALGLPVEARSLA
ncbi:MAG: double zinc ribbon domain-containing protein, partial [Anaerolineae bacterium]